MPKYILDDFNDLCTELGVQCLITMNTRDYQLDYEFKNVGRTPVAIFFGERFDVLEPDHELVFKMPSQDSPWMTYWHDEPATEWRACGCINTMGLVTDEEVDREFHILPIPPIVPEAWEFLKEAQKANRTLAEKAKDETSDFENGYPF
jgi:FMN phosphatase YigB (HAD superfamily)